MTLALQVQVIKPTEKRSLQPAEHHPPTILHQSHTHLQGLLLGRFHGWTRDQSYPCITQTNLCSPSFGTRTNIHNDGHFTSAHPNSAAVGSYSSCYVHWLLGWMDQRGYHSWTVSLTGHIGKPCPSLTAPGWHRWGGGPWDERGQWRSCCFAQHPVPKITRTRSLGLGCPFSCLPFKKIGCLALQYHP